MKIFAIEGIDNTEKSTIAVELSKATRYPVISFPDYGSDSGQLIEGMLHDRIPWNAARFQRLQHQNKEETLATLHPDGTYIFCRYQLSEIVYGLANDLDEEWVRDTAGLLPSPEVNVIITGKVFGSDDDRYSSGDFQKKVAELYKREEKNGSGAFEYVSNDGTIEEVTLRVLRAIRRFL